MLKNECDINLRQNFFIGPGPGSNLVKGEKLSRSNFEPLCGLKRYRQQILSGANFSTKSANKTPEIRLGKKVLLYWSLEGSCDPATAEMLIFGGVARFSRFFGGRMISDRGEDNDDGDGSDVAPSGDCGRLVGVSVCWYWGSRVQNPPFPGSSLDLATLMKHLLRDKLWRMEFCKKWVNVWLFSRSEMEWLKGFILPKNLVRKVCGYNQGKNDFIPNHLSGCNWGHECLHQPRASRSLSWVQNFNHNGK